MKRVLMVSCNGLELGGTQKIMMAIVKELGEECQIDFLLLSNSSGYYDATVEQKGCQVFRCPRPQYKGISKYVMPFVYLNDIYRYTTKILSQNKYDIIHCNNGYEAAPCLISARKCGVKERIFHMHTIIDYKGKGMKETAKNLLTLYYFKVKKCIEIINNESTSIIGCSRSALMSVGVEGEIVANPIDLKKYEFIPRCEDNYFTLVQVGYYSDIKNQKFSILVLKHILQQIPNSRLILIGNESDLTKKELKTFAQKCEISERVLFKDGSIDITQVYSYTDCVVMPSKSEGFGMVLIEAQSAGIVCFASNRVPIETNKGGVCFLPIEDAAVWAGQILNAYSQHKMKRQKYDCSEYSETIFFNKMRRIYGLEEKKDRITDISHGL